MTLEVETKHGLRTGYCGLNQGLAFSVPILSIDTNHILHCGLQAFNSHFCFICRGRRGNCRSVKPPKPVPRERNEKQMLPIIGKHLFLWGKSESISSCGNYLLVTEVEYTGAGETTSSACYQAQAVTPSTTVNWMPIVLAST